MPKRIDLRGETSRTGYLGWFPVRHIFRRYYRDGGGRSGGWLKTNESGRNTPLHYHYSQSDLEFSP